ncbi:LPS O-antigen chain length determinant protein WzzB [Aquipseudomonas alcaligenes]|uniref:LPS O-antigen chain length determinant protein WzzB n=1 Tax=Aquipseudomonas alcaligenes TaxID=43263 RepID=UPI000B29F315|nr:Wzz/FepE/Etk N-terminal domain-containing protein [Pseudomonas alcaligenes]
MIQGHSSARASETEDIDLLELMLLLWEQKLLIVAITVLLGVVALGYAYLSPRVYEAKASVLPPRLSEISAYNLGRVEAGLEEFKVADVYAVFTRNLNSQALRQRFFDEVYLPAQGAEGAAVSRDALWARFSQALVVSNPQPKVRPDYYEVTGRLDDPQRVADWVNRYIAMASEYSTLTMQQNVLSEINTRVQALQNRIDVLRSGAKIQREDRVTRLNEALVIAEAAGIQAPLDSPATVMVSLVKDAETLRSDQNQLYMRGAKAIKAELGVLSQRKTDDPFIPELYALRTQLAFLKSIDVKPGNVAVFTLDRAAEAPEQPANMRKSLILMIGIGVGGILGVFAALIRGLVRRRLLVLQTESRQASHSASVGGA